jgi:hypothetical protein
MGSFPIFHCCEESRKSLARVMCRTKIQSRRDLIIIDNVWWEKRWSSRHPWMCGGEVELIDQELTPG